MLKRLTHISLRFKDYKDGTFKEVTAWIGLDEAHFLTVPQTSMLKGNGAPSTKVSYLLFVQFFLVFFKFSLLKKSICIAQKNNNYNTQLVTSN